MRNVVLGAILVVACGQPAPPANAPPNTPPAAIGTSGYPGLDWGATVANVKAAYPRTTEDHGELTTTSLAVEGQPNTTTFAFEHGKLARIGIAFDRRFASMNECATLWTVVRRALDPKLGKSAGENLAAFWESTTYAVTLSCDIDDHAQAGLSMSYAPAPPP